MFCEFISKVTPNLLPLSSLAVALSSLTVSYLGFRRDRGHLEVYIGLGDIVDSTTLRREDSVISIRVVNVGRRPVTLRGIAGDFSGNWWKRRLFNIFPRLPESLQPKGTYLTGNDIRSLLFNTDGTLKVLAEGQIATANISIQNNRQAWRNLFKGVVSFYAYDTADRYYYVRSRVFRKLIRDLSTG